MVTNAIAELLLRYELGDFPPQVRARLDEIFRTDPEDALQRLQRAAEYLGITGTTKDTLDRAAAKSKARELAQSVNTLGSQNVYTAKPEKVNA